MRFLLKMRNENKRGSWALQQQERLGSLQLFSDDSSHFSSKSCRFRLKRSIPLCERWTPSVRYWPVFVPHLMLSWVRETPPRSETMVWILRFTVVRTRSTSWLSVEWRHTLRGRMFDHTRTHCGKMLLTEVKSFLTEARRPVGLSVLRSLPPKCMMRTSGLGQVTFSWWS